MNARALETTLSPDEFRAVARRKRLFQLQRIVWEMTFERFRKAILQDYDDSEAASLIAALRVCGNHFDQIEANGWLEPLIFRIDGIDNQEYIVGFELMDHGYKVFAERVVSTSIELTPEGSGREAHALTTLRGQPGFFDEITLSPVTVDRAFLVGMSMVIGLMDDRGDDEDEHLLPLLRQITPSTEELGAIATRNPTPTVLLDDDDPS